MRESLPIPVTVLTGFLGSGKTTLLNHILSAQHGRRIAVIENEFGEVGIDHALVVNADEEIFEMNNGCICCTVRGDLIRILGNLRKRRDKFDSVLIETTGLADPAPVAQTFFVDDEIREHFRLDAIVTLVDAKHVEEQLERSVECGEQIAFADVLVLNKVDLVGPGDLARIEARIRSMNRSCRVLRAERAEAELEAILDVRAFDLEARLEFRPGFLDEEAPFEWVGTFPLPSEGAVLEVGPGPDPTMQVLWERLEDASQEALEAARMRALVRFVQIAPTLKAGAMMNVEDGGAVLVPGAGGASIPVRVSEAGFYALFTQHGPEEFGLNLKVGGAALVPVQERRFAASHTHDRSVVSVGIVESVPLNLDRFDAWMGRLLKERGQDLFRVKGVLQFQGAARRYIFQGVHMLMEGRFAEDWGPGEVRESRAILIGRNLDREELLAGFRLCLDPGA